MSVEYTKSDDADLAFVVEDGNMYLMVRAQLPGFGVIHRLLLTDEDVKAIASVFQAHLKAKNVPANDVNRPN